MTNIDSLTSLADPTRRAVFEAVAANPGPVGTLAQHLPVSRSAVSQHLKVLTDAGLVQSKARGNQRLYSIRQEGLRELRDYLDQFWITALESFAEEANRKDT